MIRISVLYVTVTEDIWWMISYSTRSRPWGGATQWPYGHLQCLKYSVWNDLHMRKSCMRKSCFQYISYISSILTTVYIYIYIYIFLIIIIILIMTILLAMYCFNPFQFGYLHRRLKCLNIVKIIHFKAHP